MNNLREISRTIYFLKRKYGMPITYYHLSSSTRNVETGAIVNNWSTFTIQRAIRVIEKQWLEVISGGKNFNRESVVDSKQIVFIIDTKDMPLNFEPTSGNHIEFDGKRYEVKDIRIADHRLAYEIIAGDALKSVPVGA